MHFLCYPQGGVGQDWRGRHLQVHDRRLSSRLRHFQLLRLVDTRCCGSGLEGGGGTRRIMNSCFCPSDPFNNIKSCSCVIREKLRTQSNRKCGQDSFVPSEPSDPQSDSLSSNQLWAARCRQEVVNVGNLVALYLGLCLNSGSTSFEVHI